jgi:hypothetical protein
MQIKINSKTQQATDGWWHSGSTNMRAAVSGSDAVVYSQYDDKDMCKRAGLRWDGSHWSTSAWTSAMVKALGMTYVGIGVWDGSVLVNGTWVPELKPANKQYRRLADHITGTYTITL